MDNDNIKDDMCPMELSRWIALYEGVNIIADKAKEKGEKFDVMHIKQPALEAYVDTASGLIYRELTKKEIRNDG